MIRALRYAQQPLCVARANTREAPRVTTILKILACWGVGSIALGLWIGPMLRLATTDFADRIGGLDGPNAPDAHGDSAPSQGLTAPA
jgi:hypothetical protein